LSTLSAAELDNAKLNEGNILMLSIATLVAGNETTRNLLSGCIWALASHPEQLRLLASDPALAKSA
jgi:cytochrome P450